MSDKNGKCKVKILPGGPYLVMGGVPLSEKRIVCKRRIYKMEPGRELPQSESYALCRCGKSKNAPFCDGSHQAAGFSGEETASREEYLNRAELIEGPGIDLLDDGRCALARFCHRKDSDAWELTECSDTQENRAEAILAASECPAGRLTARGKDGTLYEPDYEPSIEIIQDPDRSVSAGISIKGGIPIESADSTTYEVRNRVMLCRCGGSRNKPFCDASHIAIEYLDK